MNKSETVGKLAEALAKAQKTMTFARRESTANYGRYADMASVVEAIKGPLADNGIAYTQTTDIDPDGGVIVETMLMHTSGEWISSPLRMKPTQATPQGVGSAITYARRYGLQAICGIPTDDDDGDAASGKGNHTQQQTTTKAKPALQHMPTADEAAPPNGTTGLVDDETVDTIKSLNAKLGNNDDFLIRKVGAEFNGKGLRGLTKLEASGLLDRLQVAVDNAAKKGAAK